MYTLSWSSLARSMMSHSSGSLMSRPTASCCSVRYFSCAWASFPWIASDSASDFSASRSELARISFDVTVRSPGWRTRLPRLLSIRMMTRDAIATTANDTAAAVRMVVVRLPRAGVEPAGVAPGAFAAAPAATADSAASSALSAGACTACTIGGGGAVSIVPQAMHTSRSPAASSSSAITLPHAEHWTR
jgi:hypothetical protein